MSHPFTPIHAHSRHCHSPTPLSLHALTTSTHFTHVTTTTTTIKKIINSKVNTDRNGDGSQTPQSNTDDSTEEVVDTTSLTRKRVIGSSFSDIAVVLSHKSHPLEEFLLSTNSQAWAVEQKVIVIIDLAAITNTQYTQMEVAFEWAFTIDSGVVNNTSAFGVAKTLDHTTHSFLQEVPMAIVVRIKTKGYYSILWSVCR